MNRVLTKQAVYFERSRQGVLAGEGLQFGEQQRGQHRSLVDRGSQAQQVIPVRVDQLRVDPVDHQRRHQIGQRGVVQAPQALVGQVPDPGREAQANDVVDAEEQVGEPGGVGGVPGDGQLAVTVPEGEDLVQGEQSLPGVGRDHLGPERCVVVGHRGEHRRPRPNPK